MEIKEFIISLAEAYGYEITKPRAKIYKQLLTNFLGEEYAWDKLLVRIVTSPEISYFPAIGKILEKSDFSYRQWEIENTALGGDYAPELESSK
jgi:hypothetical protein